MLPSELKLHAQRRAKKLGISLGEFIRESVQAFLAKREPSDDPLFSSTAIYRGPVPKDLSRRHDDYLYGDQK
jgi:hypothetical protein